MRRMRYRSFVSGMSYRPCTHVCQRTSCHEHSDHHAADQGCDFRGTKKGVPTVEGNAESLDTQLFRQHRRQCKFRNYQMVCRDTENKTVGASMQKGIKFRIYPNRTQKDLIDRTLGCCRLITHCGRENPRFQP